LKSIEIEEQNKIIAAEKSETEAALAEVLPSLQAARLALGDLDRGDITEIRSGLHTRVYPNVSGLAAWSENCE